MWFFTRLRFLRRQKPTKKAVLQFTAFNLGGTAFFVIGYASFSLFYGVWHWPWLPAKMLGDFLGWSSNFLIQYFVAFSEERRGHRPKVVAGKFTAFSLLNLAIDYAIVGGLNWIGISPFIGMFVASGFFTVWKWVGYKHWVFSAAHRSD